MSHRAFQHLLLRLAIVACVVAGALALKVRFGSGDELPVAVVDVSRSMGTDIPTPPSTLRVRPRWIVVADGAREIVGGSEAPRLARSASRLGEGLRLAASSFPGADIVLVTDGRGTDRDALGGARAVRAAGGRVFVVAPPEPAADIGFERARIVADGGGVVVRATLVASTSGRAVASLLRDDRVIDRVQVTVVPAMRRTIELRDAEPPREGVGYRVVLAAGSGTPNDDPGNDVLALGWRSDVRTVLIVGLEELEPLGLPDSLSVRSAARLLPEGLAAADAVVLANVPWTRLAGGVHALEPFVRGGGRLLILGGPHTYRPGGWTGKSIEERISPLVVNRPEGDGLAMLLLLDRSGSTGDRELAYLKAAGRSAALRLVPGERMGILPFAGAPDASLLDPGFVPGADRPARTALLTALDRVKAGGRTDIPAAVASGIDRLLAADADQRWLVLLTDGDPDNSLAPEALAPLRARLDESGVELAALVVGDEAAAEAIRAGLARRAQDVLLLDDAEEFGERLEELVRRRRLREDELPAPAAIETLEALPLPLDLNALAPRRVHDLEPAPGSSVFARVIWAEGPRRSAPFLARRAVGPGVVWGLAWGPAFESGLEARRRALAALGPTIARLAGAGDRGLAAEHVGRDLVLRLPEAAGAASVAVTGIDLAGEPFETRLVERAPGEFRGPIPEAAPGSVAAQVPGGALRPLRLPARPAPEHRGAGIDDSGMQRIARAGGGRRLVGGEPVPPRDVPAGAPLAPWLLLLAGILLILDRVLARARAGADPSLRGSEESTHHA
ncbi:MAG: vWA domain-containing protein [Planctomycetota bacterium]|nr:vWA domain-containing protein [Planctomycetota bacterium]